jgi:hypothetical protein
MHDPDGLTAIFDAEQAPGSSLLTSACTGAPAARALALGFMEEMNGTATKPTPTAPTALVAAMSTRLRLGSAA